MRPEDMDRSDMDTAFSIVVKYCSMLPSSIAQQQTAMLEKVKAQLVVDQSDWMSMTEGMADIRQQTTDIDQCYSKLLPAVLGLWKKERAAQADLIEDKNLEIESRPE